MKIRSDFVTNSSTTCYLVINADIKTDIEIENLRHLLSIFVEKHELQEEVDCDGEHIVIYEKYNDSGWNTYVNVKIPFSKALNEYGIEMKQWLENNGVEVKKVSVGINGYRDG